MSKYKIGITEAGDPAFDDSWVEKIDDVDGAVIVTKQITEQLHYNLLAYQYKLILHATITGYGGSVLEPHVPPHFKMRSALYDLVKAGFPKERIVIRIDPIIPTDKGRVKALNIMREFMEDGFSRYRISIIDMYPHVRKRFKESGLPLPYGNDFAPDDKFVKSVDDTLCFARLYWKNLKNDMDDLRIECCAEPGLKRASQSGCISSYDLELLGLCSDTPEDENVGYQRKNCLCYAGKTELLENKKQCPHGCLYCYWK